MIQQQLSTAAQELHKFCRLSTTTMDQVTLVHIHLEDADEALDAGRFRDAQICLNLFWKVVREGYK